MRRWGLAAVLLVAGCGTNSQIPWQVSSPGASPSPSATPSPPPGSATYETDLTIDGSDVQGPLTDFPVLIRLTDPRFGDDPSSGGHMSSADADDLYFSVASEIVDHEIERYTGTELFAWVRIPDLDQGVNTVITAHYGNPAITSPQNNPSAVWNGGFLGVWHLDESVPDEGVEANAHLDSTSNANNADAAGNDESASAKIARGQSFDGNDFVDVGDVLDFTANDAFTISFWMRKEQLGDQLLIAKTPGVGANDEGYAVGLTMGRVIVEITDSDTEVEALGNTTLDVAMDVHIAAQWEAGQIRIFVNGNAENVSLTGDPGELNGSFATTAPLTIGAISGGGFFGWVGEIDEVRIESVARSPAWIETSQINQNNPGGFITVGPERVIPVGN